MRNDKRESINDVQTYAGRLAVATKTSRVAADENDIMHGSQLRPGTLVLIVAAKDPPHTYAYAFILWHAGAGWTRIYSLKAV